MAKKGTCPERKKIAVDINKGFIQRYSGIERKTLIILPKTGMSLGFREKKLPRIVRTYFKKPYDLDTHAKLRDYALQTADELGVSLRVVMSIYSKIKKLENSGRSFDFLKKEAEEIDNRLNPREN